MELGDEKICDHEERLGEDEHHAALLVLKTNSMVRSTTGSTKTTRA
jgi:hypothetical protein